MAETTVDLIRNERGALFVADEEAIAAGWATGDPYPGMLRLLDEGQAVREGAFDELLGLPPQFAQDLRDRPHYTALSFDAVNQAFMDGETFTNHIYDYLSKPQLGDTLLNMDGDQHRRTRNVAKPYFKPAFADGWWNDNYIVKAVGELFDRITAKDYADLNLEMCAPLPMSVVSAGFGIPADEILAFRLALTDVMGHGDPDRARKAGGEIHRILSQVITERRVEPREDLISKFVHADFETENGEIRKLTDAEVMQYCNLIVFAGGGTTWRQMGITIKALLDHPEQLELLRADRTLLRQTIQESTRWYPTDPVFERYVVKDTVLGGVEMKAGSILWLCVASANRDRTQWEDPDTFDITRPIKRHFAFGAGVHACLGQHLSRREMEVALGAVLDRLPDLRWDTDKAPSRMSGGTIVGRGPDALNVRFTPGH